MIMNKVRLIAAIMLFALPLSVMAGHEMWTEGDDCAKTDTVSSSKQPKVVQKDAIYCYKDVWDKKNKEPIRFWAVVFHDQDSVDFKNLEIMIITKRDSVYQMRKEGHAFYFGDVKGPVFKKNVELYLADSHFPLWNTDKYPEGVIVCKLELCLNVKERLCVPLIRKCEITYRKMEDKYKNRIHVNCIEERLIRYDGDGNVL